jgi:hypothetical protein
MRNVVCEERLCKERFFMCEENKGVTGKEIYV